MKVSGVRRSPEGSSSQSIVSGSRASASSNKIKIVATRALWVVIVLIHLACGGYYVSVALLYHMIPTTIVGTHMKANQLVIDTSDIPVVIGCFGVFAVLHVVFLCEMIFKSARRRSLFFHSRAFRLIGAFIKIKSQRRMASARVKVGELVVHNHKLLDSVLTVTTKSLRRVEKTASQAWECSFGATGYFGVGGKYFALLFLVRETVETALQSVQAHSFSKYVPGLWLNRSAVAIVVASCWSTPVIHKLLHRSPRLQLIVCLLVDTLLDIASSIGTPVALGATYFPHYNATVRNFQDADWGNNAWVANLNSEFKQLFVQSWFDLSMRALFAATLLMSLDDVKLLAATFAADTVSRLVTPHTLGIPVARARQRFEKLVHFLLIVWGFVIIALHFSSAGGDADLTDCMVQVRPWLATQATCVAISIDCNKHDGMVGTSAELEACWASLDAQAVRMLIFTNCPELHMPPSIRAFPNLMGLYIYFSTVIEWSASAAVSRFYHPNLRQISLVAVNVTMACDASSSLPPGLVAPDFPSTLGTFIAVGVELDRLPSNLPEIWPRGLVLLLLADGFNDVPDVLLRMAPERISLQYNNITRLPAAIFELPTLKWLEVSASPLSELPEHVNPSPALVQINFVSTNVASLPEWMTRESFLRRVQVMTSMTPLCTQLQAAIDPDSKALARQVC